MLLHFLLTRGNIHIIAFKRLRKGRDVVANPIVVDLILAIPLFLNDTDVTIRSGWFASLGLPNLNSVMLSGNDVDQVMTGLDLKMQ